MAGYAPFQVTKFLDEHKRDLIVRINDKGLLTADEMRKAFASVSASVSDPFLESIFDFGSHVVNDARRTILDQVLIDVMVTVDAGLSFQMPERDFDAKHSAMIEPLLPADRS
jgi:hypothetical protein